MSASEPGHDLVLCELQTWIARLERHPLKTNHAVNGGTNSTYHGSKSAEVTDVTGQLGRRPRPVKHPVEVRSSHAEAVVRVQKQVTHKQFDVVVFTLLRPRGGVEQATRKGIPAIRLSPRHTCPLPLRRMRPPTPYPRNQTQRPRRLPPADRAWGHSENGPRSSKPPAMERSSPRN